jgi:MFS family permease
MTAPETTALPTRTAFRVFWSGQAVSFVGSEVSQFALPIVGIVTLKAAPAALGVLVAAGLVPNLLAPFFAGPIVDRVRKRGLMLGTDLLRAALVAAVPLLYVTGLLDLAALAVLAFATGTLSVLFDVAYFAFLPALVPPADLVYANGRLEASRSGATLVGPGLAGALVQLLAAPFALLVDAATFLFSAATLGALRGVTAGEPEPAPPQRYLRTVAEGFTAIARYPALRLLGLGSGAFNFFAAASMTVTALYVIRGLGVAVGAYGVATALGGLGGLLAGTLAPRITARIGLRPAFCGGLFVAALGECVIVAAPPHHGWTVGFVTLSGFVGSLGATVYVVTNASLRQILVPAPLRGRIYATMRMLNRSSMPPGALLGGLLATFTSPLFTLVCVVLGQVAVAMVFTRYRRLLPARLDGSS